ncbi:hypothetical protein Tco_1297667 [Tanacetum coccineum]
MAIMAENVIATGAENRPPMLKKGMYDSWKSRILLYIKGKENGEMLIDSINNGLFQFKKEIIIPATEGTPEHKHPQKLKDLTPEKKLSESYDIKATSIILLGKDNKDKSEQNQSKPTKKRKRQDKMGSQNNQSRISPTQEKKFTEAQCWKHEKCRSLPKL